MIPRWTVRALKIFSLSFCLASCAEVGMSKNGKPVELAALKLFGSQSSTRTNDSDSQTGKVRYGNFCGAGNDSAPSSDESLRKLVGVEPVDDIDSACRWHDVCYSQKGYFDLNCDRELMLRLSRMQFEDERCSSLSQAVYSYFAVASPNFNRSGGAENFFHYVMRAAALPFNLLGSAAAIKEINKYNNNEAVRCEDVSTKLNSCRILKPSGKLSCLNG